MSINNGDNPAFPMSEEETDRISEGVYIFSGLTKREYFAGLAMQGMLSDISRTGGWDYDDFAKDSVEAADALLAALDKDKE